MIGHLTDTPQEVGGHTDRLVGVLLDELALMPKEHFHLPVSDHPKIRDIANVLRQWAAHVAVSERSLARLMIQEIGLTFGRWRQQL